MSETHKWSVYDFSRERNVESHRCSECGTVVLAGGMMWVSRSLKGNRYVKKGGVAKRVCSEDCGQTFDYREMSHRASMRIQQAPK